MNLTHPAILFALGTVICWGLYSVLLHQGSIYMKGTSTDATAARMKAFLLVGIAYFVVAIVGPVIILLSHKSSWNFPTLGWTWSLGAGIAGAVGAFFLLMALSSGKPSEMSTLIAIIPTIVFAGAPIVNALVSVAKEGLWEKVQWQFWMGILLAAAGAGLVMKFKPSAGPGGHGGPPKTGAATMRVAPGYVDVTTRSYHIT